MSKEYIKLNNCPGCEEEIGLKMEHEYFAKVSNGCFSVNCSCGVTGPESKTLQGAVDKWQTMTAFSKDEIVKMVISLVEDEGFESVAGCITKFQPWIKLKEILGVKS